MYVEGVSTRPLPEISYMTVDATYYKVRIDGVGRDCATLSAHGLKERGIGIPDLITSDARSGQKAALKACENVVGLFPSRESLLRLVTGVLIDISETWETGKAYITLS